MLQRMRQFDPAAADPGVIASSDLKRRVLWQLLTGFRQLCFPGEYQSCHHQRLRPGAAFREPAIREQLIKTSFRSHYDLLHGPETR